MDNIAAADRKIALVFNALAEDLDYVEGTAADNFRVVKLAILKDHGITEEEYNAWGQDYLPQPPLVIYVRD